MRPTAFLPPYTAPRKTAFKASMRQAGVYLICENGVLVYVGYAGECIYRTMYRHFQGWTDKHYASHKVSPPPYRVSYRRLMDVNSYTVRLIHCSKKQAARLEKILILKYKPRDNYIKYEKYERDGWDSRIERVYDEFVAREIDCPF